MPDSHISHIYGDLDTPDFYKSYTQICIVIHRFIHKVIHKHLTDYLFRHSISGVEWRDMENGALLRRPS
jgi:hypothetical protein